MKTNKQKRARRQPITQTGIQSSRRLFSPEPRVKRQLRTWRDVVKWTKWIRRNREIICVLRMTMYCTVTIFYGQASGRKINNAKSSIVIEIWKNSCSIILLHESTEHFYRHRENDRWVVFCSEIWDVLDWHKFDDQLCKWRQSQVHGARLIPSAVIGIDRISKTTKSSDTVLYYGLLGCCENNFSRGAFKHHHISKYPAIYKRASLSNHSSAKN